MPKIVRPFALGPGGPRRACSVPSGCTWRYCFFGSWSLISLMPPPLPRFRSDAPAAGPRFRTEVCSGSGACGSSLGRRQRGIGPALSRFLSDAPAVVPLLRPVAGIGVGAFGSSKTGRACPAIVVGYCCPAIRVGWLGLSPAFRLRSARVRLPVSLVPWLARSGPSCFALVGFVSCPRYAPPCPPARAGSGPFVRSRRSARLKGIVSRGLAACPR